MTRHPAEAARAAQAEYVAQAGRAHPRHSPETPAPSFGVRRGDFHGRQTRILASRHCWIEVLAAGGPRVVRFGLPGCPSAFAETPDVRWETEFGIYELLGGHRLWFAPERPELIAPENALELAQFSGGPAPSAKVSGCVEPRSGLRRSIEVHLDPDAASVSVRHGLRNEGAAPIELAAWPITQLPLGGVAIVPQPRRDGAHAVRPNRSVVLWPYSDWRDERLILADGLLAVRTRSGRAFKIGCRSEAGTAAYLRDGLLFVKRIDPALDAAHTDIGCNVEVYTDERSCELETLGPLVRLAPGQDAAFEERWELRAVPPLPESAGAESLLAVLEPLAADGAAR